MAWHEKGPSGNYFVCLRVGDQRFRRSLKTTIEKEADGAVACVEENLRLLERGRLEIPPDADVVSFLLSNGRVTAPLVIPEQISLRDLFTRYFGAIPEGSLEPVTIYNMKLHQKRLEERFGPGYAIRTLTVGDLQEYIENRSKDRGRNGKVTAATIKKAIVTLRTVWNWAVQQKFVEGRFPSKGLRYPKGKEKPPYMPFRDVERLAKGMSASEAAELWECVFLPEADVTDLLKHVRKSARHPFIYPLFVFAAHTGARRSEIARAKVPDVDFVHGVVTLHERKKSHDKKTTRRVPMSGLLKKVLTDWIKHHPGGAALFCHGATVSRSKKRSERTGFAWKDRPSTLTMRMAKVKSRSVMAIGPLTGFEMHDHFKRTLSESRWKNLQGWHCFRHSFISCLAAKGIDQRIIDEFSGHQTEEQRRRYRHLAPNQTSAAIASVFG